ncbi:MAG: antitoxin [Actinobacteria bacterium]|jgi:glycerol uptake facilitator-like aquaporin|nr:antitoxin [Actinomycetota bacterium]NDA41384.1 antitoxin [Actinomycetota bacterium]NDB31563.1 antitoxin [Actinomycetota bacterium]NDC51759.1 antitoxin [Actinomycetota bacterium]NDE51287.1 antitoxin [Actinomycetota bacterium]
MKLNSYAAEFLGTALITTAVIGSGIAASQLTEIPGLALLINAIATVLTLALMIALLQPISGAHFNPAVSFVAFLNKQMKFNSLLFMVLSQCIGAVSGAALANLMFSQTLLETSNTTRSGSGLLVGEVLATGGLIFAILIAIYNNKPQTLHWIVPLWIGGAYFFTSSTSFANPAVTLGRALSDTYAGIAPSSALTFIGAQFIGAFLGLSLAKVVRNQ